MGGGVVDWSEWPPEGITISIDRPVVEKPSDSFIIEYEPGPYMSVEIRGEADKVQPFASMVVELAKALYHSQGQ